MSHSPIAATRRTIDQCCGQCGSVAGYACTGMNGQPVSSEWYHFHYIEPIINPPEPTDLEKRLARIEAKQELIIKLLVNTARCVPYLSNCEWPEAINIARETLRKLEFFA